MTFGATLRKEFFVSSGICNVLLAKGFNRTEIEKIQLFTFLKIQEGEEGKQDNKKYVCSEANLTETERERKAR